MNGISPSDIALAGAVADGIPNAAAGYYNPAALAALEHTQFEYAYVYFQPQFEGGVVGQEQFFGQSNRTIALLMAVDFGKIFASDLPIGIALNMIVDDNGGTLVHFDDSYYPKGVFTRYGVRPFLLINSIGFRAYGPLNLGIGYMITSNSEVKLVQDVQITGQTDNEQITQIGRPALIPIASVQIKTDPINIGIVYRAKMISTIDPVFGTTTVKIGSAVFDQYDNHMQFKDGFAPQQVALAFGIQSGKRGSVTIQGEWLNWDRFNDEIAHCDVARSKFDIRTKDIWIGRIAGSFRPVDGLALRGGYAYEPSPFDRYGSCQLIILDNNRHRFGLGAGYSIKPKRLSAPMSFDAALSYLQLENMSSKTTDGIRIRSMGFGYGATAGITLRF